MAADINERVGVVETKVANLDAKLDDLKGDVKEMHDCLDKTRDTIKEQLDKMYDASCDQHAALNRDIKELKKDRDRFVYTMAGLIAALGLLSGHADKVMKLFG
jgi:predicted  nucleic acid-binding Zn-ribbon protein